MASNANTNTSTTTTSNRSPRHSADNLSGHQSRRTTRAASSPWTQNVRGESEPIAAVPSSQSMTAIEQAVASPSSSSASPPVEEESPENGLGTNGNAGKRPAWNKPSNEAVEIRPVMGAVSWPALSESTRASTKSSSDSLKALSDGSLSLSVPQGTGTVSLSSPKQVSNNANPSSTQNHPVPARQRSMKRSVGSTSSNGGLPQSPAPHMSIVEGPSSNPSPRDHTQRSGFVPQSHGGNDHPQPRNSFRNRNGGPHPRGDGSHHNSYGGRRDHDRGNQDWNNHRNFNGRDAYMPPQRVVPRFMRHPPPPPPPSSTPFIAPPPVRPFGSPMGFPELASPVYYVAAPPPESLRGVPFVTPMAPPAMFFQAMDPQLHSRIVTQIDYYFSNENLIKDTYLRKNMDDQGWVPIKLIAGFNKVMHLTDNIQLILDAMRSSTVVEVQGDKVRKRNDWMRWIMPPSVQFPNVSAPPSLGKSSHDALASRVQNISLEQKATNHSSARSQADVHLGELSRSSSGDMNSQSQLSASEGTGQVSGQVPGSISVRNSN